MHHVTVRYLTAALVAAAACAPPPARAPRSARALGAAPPLYVLLEPAPELPRVGGLPVMRPLAAGHPHRAALERTLARPFLRWVLALGDEARRRGHARCGGDAACLAPFAEPPTFVITPGGNRPRQGLAIVERGITRQLPDALYVEIDPDRAAELIPHEYGHVLMAMSLPGELPQKPQTLPHTTGAITNDVVALTEGWGIHFETLAGDRRDETATYAHWHRDAFTTDGAVAAGDSMLPVTDLFNYAQTYRRYTCIKENCFAYLPRIPEAFLRDRRPTADDVLARWTDTTFDPARVRSLAQMVASEGVIATLFYRLATADGAGPDALPDPARYAAFFDAFARVTGDRARTTPAVLVLLEALLEQAAPAERRRIARIALEVFHYTPGVVDAPRLYAELHAAGHRVDKPAFVERLARATPELEGAVARLVAEPRALAAAAPPELWITNAAIRLELPVLGLRQRPLVFDLNAVPVELLMTIPGVGPAEARAIDEARRHRPLRSVDELATIAGLPRTTVDAVRAMREAFTAPAR